MANPNDAANTDSFVDERLATLTPGADWMPDAARALTRIRRETARDRPHRGWAATLVMVAASGAIILTFPATQVLAERCVAACVAQSARLTTLFWPSPPGRHDAALAAGQPAPDFTLATRAGTPLTLSTLRGHVVLLNFWATWCRPCTREMPWFAEFQRTYGPRGLDVVGVSLDEDGWAVVAPFLDQHEITYPVVLGDDVVSNRYGDVASLPTTFLIDRTGRILSRHVGLVERSDYEREIQLLIER